MNEIIKAFGIDGRLITIQIVNFAVLLFALSYFLYTPILKLIDDRKKLIAKGVADAKDAAVKLENAEKEGNVLVTKAVTEASEIVKRGNEAASREGAALITEAHDQSSRIIAEGEKKATALADSIRAKTESEIAKVAILAAEKILKEQS